MPAVTQCPRCRRIGFVRFERVIRAGLARRHYYCGACNHTWAVDDDGTVTANHGQAPQRSRHDG